MKNLHLPLSFYELTDDLPVELERRLGVHNIYLRLHREQLQEALAETEAALGSLATQESIPTKQESPALPPETQ